MEKVSLEMKFDKKVTRNSISIEGSGLSSLVIGSSKWLM